MNEDANDIGKADDPSTYKEAMKDENSCTPKCKCFKCHFSEANGESPILTKPLVWNPIIAIFWQGAGHGPLLTLRLADGTRQSRARARKRAWPMARARRRACRSPKPQPTSPQVALPSGERWRTASRRCRLSGSRSRSLLEKQRSRAD